MKIKELVDKPVAELQKFLAERRAELSLLTMKVLGNQEKHVRKVRLLKRDIARILTVLNRKSND